MAGKGQPKTGGRQKGTKNKRTLAQVYAAEIGGDMPLEHLLAIMRDVTQPADRRLSAAVAAAPYCHCKFKAIAHRGMGGGPIEYEVDGNEERMVRRVTLHFGDDPKNPYDPAPLTIAKDSDTEMQRETASE